MPSTNPQQQQQQQQPQQQQQQHSSSSSSVWTKSTIYKQHETRRAKTIQNVNDDRPALVRILAQLRPTAAAAAASVVPLSVLPAAPLSVVDTDTTTSFTMHDSSPSFTFPTSAATATTTHQTQTRRYSPNTVGYAALSAALGARLADAGMTFLSSSTQSSSSAAVTVPRTTSAAAPFLEASGSSLSLRYPAAATVPAATAIVSAPSRSTSSLFLRAPPTHHVPRSILISPSVLPLVVLFGTQAAAAGSSSDTLSATLVASSVAGAALSVIRTGAGRTSMLQESGAAVLYFGSYKLLRCSIAFLGGDDQHPSIGSAAIAGAMAGTLYEAVRGQALFVSSSSTTTASPFGRPVFSLARAAPAHALFFVGYETAQSLLA